MTPSSTTMELQMRLAAGQLRTDKVVIVADDLTGACDSGVAFLACGHSVRVVLDSTGLESRLHGKSDPEVWVFTTETRDLPPDQASERVANRVASLESILDRTLLFKKVDSAARGHLGVEISTALRCSGTRLALVAPAFPDTERTVESGVLTVRDWSGQNTAVSLRDLFPHENTNEIKLLPTGSVQQLEQGIARALTTGTRILLCDSITQEDLENLAAAGLRVQHPLLWAGSAGLAHALAGKLQASSPNVAVQTSRRYGRTLLFVGTPHPVTSLQVSYLEEQSVGMGRTTHRIPSAAASEQEVVDAFAVNRAAALILTGGDTAAFVLRALGASSIVLAGEIARGIPWGVIEGGVADGCIVVTKSGGFGERAALVHAFEFCERRSSAPA